MNIRIPAVLAITLVAMPVIALPTEAPAAAPEPYRLQAGDVLQVTVWKEAELQSEVLIRPDGGLSFPLAGELTALGRSVEELRLDLEDRLKKLIPDAAVTVALKAVTGNRVYVIGKVARPGDFVLTRPTDVMQALSLAGGATPFADTDAIRILRREGSRQVAIEFHYSDIERGRKLEQNLILHGGDTVVVP